MGAVEGALKGDSAADDESCKLSYACYTWLRVVCSADFARVTVFFFNPRIHSPLSPPRPLLPPSAPP